MHYLRQTKLIARFMLVWFVMSIGVAMASPMVKPQVKELICTGTGVMKMQATGDESGAPSTTLDCPLCVTVSVLSSPASPSTPLRPLTVLVLQGFAPDPGAQSFAAPLPARGPPAFS